MSSTTFSSGTVISSAWLNDTNSAVYKAQSGTAGTTDRTLLDKFTEFVSVKDFGAVGTAVAGNVTADTAAFTAALASGKNVYIPEGTYYISSTMTVGAAVKLHGAGRGRTTVNYTGTGNAFLVGLAGPSIVLTYDCEIGGFTVNCTNRASTVNGVVLENAVYFKVFDMTIIGSGSPNSVTPADWVLYGSGLSVTNNSILGTIERVSCRIWNAGYYFWTKSTSSSHWCAAIEVHSGEVANNMYGIIIGDSTVSYNTASGVSFHDVWVQGNYTTGIRNYSGESTLFDNIYFESNANYDYDEGGGTATPVKNMLHRCTAATEGIGTTNYGTFPYLAKFRFRTGSFASAINNDCSVSTTIPLIQVDAAVINGIVEKNRVNSTAATTARISNSSTTTITRDNFPEAPTIKTGTITRALDGASGDVAYTGIGFRPTSIEFFASVATDTLGFSDGFCDASSGIENQCTTRDSATGAISSSSNCIKIVKPTTADIQSAVLKQFDADGFTLTWTKTGTPAANTITVGYIARR
jgi:hypothetical protein